MGAEKRETVNFGRVTSPQSSDVAPNDPYARYHAQGPIASGLPASSQRAQRAQRAARPTRTAQAVSPASGQTQRSAAHRYSTT